MSNIPHSFICPLTKNIINDPVICQDGRTYERAAIQEWFGNHNTSPMTGESILTNVIQNRALKCAIEEWKQHRTIEPVNEQSNRKRKY